MAAITFANLVWILSFFLFPYQNGWPRIIEGGVDFSSPVLVDVNDDDTLEVLVAGNTRWVYLFNCRGENMPGWPKSTSIGPGPAESSSPSVADIDNDGIMEIVYASNVGSLFAWELDGTDVTGFPVNLSDNVIRACTMLEDIDGDDTLEICIGTGASIYRFFVYRHDGTLLFSRDVEYRIHSTAAGGDIDHDQGMEIVHGVDRNVQYGVYAWESNGDTCAGWPQATGYHVDGSPALADINGDSLYEIFVGSIDNNMYGWDYLGENLPSWPNEVGSGVYEGIISSPAIGDIDNDGTLDIVVGRGIIQSTYGAIFAFRATGDTLAGFPINIATGAVTSSPVLGDIDGDLGIEIVDGCQDGNLYAYNPDGTIAAGFPIAVAQSVTSSPALGDIDLDGDIEIAVGGKGNPGSNDSLYIWDLSAQYLAQRVPWPMFHHDPRHTGRYPLQGFPVYDNDFYRRWPCRLRPTVTTGKLSFNRKVDDAVRVRVYSVSGKEMKRQSLDLSGLPEGIYFVRFWTDDGTVQGMSKVVLVAH